MSAIGVSLPETLSERLVSSAQTTPDAAAALYRRSGCTLGGASPAFTLPHDLVLIPSERSGLGWKIKLIHGEKTAHSEIH